MTEPETKEIEVVSINQELAQIDKSRLEVQLEVARRYPRSTELALKAASKLIKMDPEAAEESYYVLTWIKDKNGKNVVGPSVRMAEIMANTWGHLQWGARPAGIGEAVVTAQAYCYDLQTNSFVTMTKTRPILKSMDDKYDPGGRFSEHMINTTMLACMAVAKRDAIFEIIPKVFANRFVKEAMAVYAGDEKSMQEKRKLLIEAFAGIGVSDKELFAHLGLGGAIDIGIEDIVEARGLYTAIKEGTATVDEIFRKLSGDTPTPPSNELDDVTTKLDKQTKARDAKKTKAAKKPPQPKLPTADELSKMDIDELTKVCDEHEITIAPGVPNEAPALRIAIGEALAQLEQPPRD